MRSRPMSRRVARTALAVALLAMSLVAGGRVQATNATIPSQIPLCMIGDSITWSGEGDYWRKFLLEELPALAFVGTHSAKLGFSHAGEGGNNTDAVLRRLADIPDCPYYSLEIGTNNNNVKDESLLHDRAARTADQIVLIVKELLGKPSVKKVFLGSVLPCQTKNPLRDRANAATNAILRAKMDAGELPRDRVTWVEYEKPIRAEADWGSMIRLHPNQEGYRLLAKILADAIAAELDIEDRTAAPKPVHGTGVRVENLWDAAQQCTTVPIIAGWYTLSFKLSRVTADRPTVTVSSVGESVKHPFKQAFPVESATAGGRVTLDLFTQYEGYRYTRSAMTVTADGCDVTDILFEKRRPSGAASAYAVGSYIDTQTPPAPGEPVEAATTLRP